MIIRFIIKLNDLILRALHIISFIGLMVMMLIVTANIIGRIFLKRPIMGTLEITGFAGIIIVSIAVGFAQKEERNIYLDILVSKFSRDVQLLTKSVTLILSLVAVSVLFWSVAQSAVESFLNEEVTITLGIKTYPFRFIWAIGLLVLCGYILLSFIKNLRRRDQK